MAAPTRSIYRELDPAFGGRSRGSGEYLELAYADTDAFPELLAIYHLFGDPALKLRWRATHQLRSAQRLQSSDRRGSYILERLGY